MALQKVIAKNTGAQAASYVGDRGELFFDPENPQLKASDGVTPGGVALAEAGNLNVVAQTVDRTLVLDDAGKMILVTTGNIVVPTNAQVAFPIGTLISIATLTNDSIITRNGSVELYKMTSSASTTSTTLTVVARSIASLLKVGTDTWYVSGNNTN